MGWWRWRAWPPHCASESSGPGVTAGLCAGMGRALKHFVVDFVVFVLWVASYLLVALLSLLWLCLLLLVVLPAACGVAPTYCGFVTVAILGCKGARGGDSQRARSCLFVFPPFIPHASRRGPPIRPRGVNLIAVGGCGKRGRCRCGSSENTRRPIVSATVGVAVPRSTPAASNTCGHDWPTSGGRSVACVAHGRGVCGWARAGQPPATTTALLGGGNCWRERARALPCLAPQMPISVSSASCLTYKYMLWIKLVTGVVWPTQNTDAARLSSQARANRAAFGGVDAGPAARRKRRPPHTSVSGLL